MAEWETVVKGYNAFGQLLRSHSLVIAPFTLQVIEQVEVSKFRVHIWVGKGVSPLLSSTGARLRSLDSLEMAKASALQLAHDALSGMLQGVEAAMQGEGGRENGSNG